jgi:hypothetical protein
VARAGSLQGTSSWRWAPASDSRTMHTSAAPPCYGRCCQQQQQRVLTSGGFTSAPLVPSRGATPSRGVRTRAINLIPGLTASALIGAAYLLQQQQQALDQVRVFPGPHGVIGHQRARRARPLRACARCFCGGQLQRRCRDAGHAAAPRSPSLLLVARNNHPEPTHKPKQDRQEAGERRACPSCGGSGLQPCACTRWSDSDVGCSTCSQSGWMKCSSCGGGGTAVPIKVSIRRCAGSWRGGLLVGGVWGCAAAAAAALLLLLRCRSVAAATSANNSPARICAASSLLPCCLAHRTDRP